MMIEQKVIPLGFGPRGIFTRGIFSRGIFIGVCENGSEQEGCVAVGEEAEGVGQGVVVEGAPVLSGEG